MKIAIDEERSYPEPDNKYSSKCDCCEKFFAGPKKAHKCYPCSQIGEQLIFDFASI